MPASNVTEAQARTDRRLSAFACGRESGATAVNGDAARGKLVFDGKGNCASCHSVAGVGARKARTSPNVGAARRAPELERALLDPQADVQPNHRSYRVVLQDGTTVTGRLLGYDTFNVRLLDGKEQLRSFAKSDLQVARLHRLADAVIQEHADAAGDRRHRQLSVVAAGRRASTAAGATGRSEVAS